MQEILKGESSRVQVAIYKNGKLINADGNVVVNIYDADDATNVLISTGNAINEPPLGIYAFYLSPTVTDIKRILRVEWLYSVDSVATSTTNFVSVLTPYATVSDIVDYYDFGTNPQDLNYRSPNKIIRAESLARTLIDGYSGQTFNKKYGSQEVFGIGSDAVWLTERMLSIDKMYENNVLMIDNTASPAYNNFGYGLEITQTGKTIRIINTDSDIRYDNMVDPTILYYGKFRDHSRYKFFGEIGWSYVPQDIKLCSILLVGDLLSNDAAWRNKYLKQVSLSEIDFTMHSGAFNGTGNLIVDNILDRYRNVGIVII